MKSEDDRRWSVFHVPRFLQMLNANENLKLETQSLIKYNGIIGRARTAETEESEKKMSIFRCAPLAPLSLSGIRLSQGLFIESTYHILFCSNPFDDKCKLYDMLVCHIPSLCRPTPVPMQYLTSTQNGDSNKGKSSSSSAISPLANSTIFTRHGRKCRKI